MNAAETAAYKGRLTAFLICALIGHTSTHSQTITSTDSREITYDRLEEFAKAVEFRKQADSLLYSYEQGLKYADSIIQSKDQTIRQYKDVVVPEMVRESQLKDELLKNEQLQWSIELQTQKAKTKKARRNGWIKTAGGIVAGILLITFAGG